MTRAEDVIGALTGLHTKIAKALDEAPTGVPAGYSAVLGATVNPNGTLRYVGGIAAALIWEDDVTGNDIPNNTSTALLFLPTNASYTSYTVDTGAYWDVSHPARLVFPATGYYDILGSIAWPGNATGVRVATLNYLNASGVQVTGMTSTRVPGFSSSGGPTQQVAIQHWPAAAGYGVELVGRQNSGGLLSTTGVSFLSVRRVG